MDKKKKVQTTVRIDAKLQKQVQHACINRGVTQTDALLEGLRLWLKYGMQSGTLQQIEYETPGAAPVVLVGGKKPDVGSGQLGFVHGRITNTTADIEEWVTILNEILTSDNVVAQVFAAGVTANLRMYQISVALLDATSRAGSAEGTREQELKDATEEIKQLNRRIRDAIDRVKQSIQESGFRVDSGKE